jgi:hypothetical protein
LALTVDGKGVAIQINDYGWNAADPLLIFFKLMVVLKHYV